MRSLRTPLITLLLVAYGCAAAPAAPVAAGEPAPQPFNVLGREDAPVTIIEFTDLQCPHCARFASQTFPQLRRNYIDAGLVRFASRDLPLPNHAHAVPAAIAARCAGEQGRFWEFREALFARRAALATEPYAGLAREFGLDAGRFATCRSDGRQAANVQSDLELARAGGITATPSFVIGRVVDGQFQGEVVTGAKPYEEFAARIDALLEASR